jgi:hypothetical protein
MVSCFKCHTTSWVEIVAGFKATQFPLVVNQHSYKNKQKVLIQSVALNFTYMPALII